MKTHFLTGHHTIRDYFEAYDLRHNRPHLTQEKHKSNDYYGHMEILRHYSGFLDSPECSIEHGFSSPASFIWEVDQKAPFASHWVMTEQRVAKIIHNIQKWSIAIGPFIHYAPLALDSDLLTNEKKRLGKSLLLFPAHSTHFNHVKFDSEKFISRIKSISHNYDSIRCCLYWADLESPFARCCEAEGWEIVNAGHLYDSQFLSRLKTLLYLCDGIVYNSFGTQVAYAALLNKPQLHIPLDWSVKIDDAGRFISKQEYYNQVIFDGMAEFSNFHSLLDRDNLNRPVSNYLNRFCGLSSLRSPNELRDLFRLNQQIQSIYLRSKVEFNPTLLQRLDFDDQQSFDLYREELFRNQINENFFEQFSDKLKIYLNKDLF